VTSISVALQSVQHIPNLSQPNLGCCGDGPGAISGEHLQGDQLLEQIAAAHLPEHPQEPVIDRPKNTRHACRQVAVTVEDS
jgi:hypothetical protein